MQKKKKVFAVSSNVAVRGDSSPCSRGLWSQGIGQMMVSTQLYAAADCVAERGEGF